MEYSESKLDKAEKKKTFCKYVKAGLRYISLAEYHTPLYFTNKDSYKSATSGLLTILLGLAFAILGYNIFMPILMKETYKSEIKEIQIRSAYINQTVESCTICRNFTIREALNYTFNGNMYLMISSGSKKLEEDDCKNYSLDVNITGLDHSYPSSFEYSIFGCQQKIYDINIT
jgi:hypothetical protein